MASVKTVNFLPTIFRSAPNRKFLHATLDQLVSEPSFKKLNGYVGRRFAPTFKPTDNYLPEPTAQRQQYQLEPSTVVVDENKNISFFSSYADLIQQIEYYGGNTTDHSRLFENEYYSFNGQIDFDKLVNFNQYYWIPNGPAAVDVFSGALDNEKSYFVTRNAATQSYNFTGHADAQNPDIYLARGGVYEFNLNQAGSPFWIQTDPGTDGTRRGQSNISTRDVYGVENNGSESGIVTFRVPQVDAQDEYVNMPIVAAVDMATALPFNAIDNQLLEVVIDQFGGIDGVTSNLAGKYLAFVSDSLSDAEWEELGVYAYLGYGNDPYDHGELVPDDQRLGIWQIQLEDSTEGDQIVRLVYSQDIGVGEKIFVKSGDKYANREYYKAIDGLLYEVPLITATLTELFYNDGTDQSFYGRIRIVSDVSYSIDVQADILGKTQYVSPNGVIFTNGLKVLFDSQTVPASYANNEYYVEGVGTGIRLVAVNQLATPELDIGVSSVPFDIYSYDTGAYDQILNGPLTADYITINRSSIDRNAWSRSNRWFHVDIIAATAAYNNTVVTYDGMTRGQRPIIEFNPDLQLFNNGRVGHKIIDILDFSVADAMSTVEGQTNYYIGTAKVENGMRILFAGDTDPIIRDRIYVANVLDINGVNRIHLTQATDVHVSDYDTIVATSGLNKGITYWFDGSVWIKSQQKTKTNQPPLFDIVDENGASFASYDHSTFTGCKVFSFKEGSGTNDTILGFPLSYRNFNSVGDIQFANNFDSDSISYQVNKVAATKEINAGFLQKINGNLDVTVKNVWSTNKEKSKQYQIFTNVFTDNNTFYIDVLPTSTSTIPYLKVYVNSKPLDSTEYNVIAVGARTAIYIPTLIVNDVVDILIYSRNVSQTGYYEIPSNINYNALNDTFDTLTLGQFRNHLVAVASNSSEVAGSVPGRSNMRDLDVIDNGGCILQHSAPAVYGSVFLLDKEANFIDSIAHAQHEYTRFKHKFLEQFPRVIDAKITSAREGVDYILKALNIVKNKSMPWYYSDMIPYDENKTVIDYTVLNLTIDEYEIDEVFNDTVLSNKAILVYLDGTQLTKGIDYEFSKTRPAIRFYTELDYDQQISIHIYHDTDGNYIPETPTKLGLYPKFKPELYLDSTYQLPIDAIRGHDGSVTPAFGDFRDDLLIELERRIYNNIKVAYDPTSFDINSVVPGKFRDTGYTKAEFDAILTRSFLSWISNNRLDYSTNEWFDANNAWTWVYSGFRDPLHNEFLPGSWRGIYRYFYDTDAPNERPWEMLGFGEMPSWWVDTYGPAPYTGGNMVLWGDLEAGHIAAGDRMGIDKYYARPGLSTMIPVDDAGNLRSPEQFAVQEFSSLQANGTFVIGDEGPVEAAWRRSSDYAFAIQRAIALTKPAMYFGRLASVHKYRKHDVLAQYITSDNFRRITPDDFAVNGLATDKETIVRNAGYLNWIADYLTSMGIDPATKITSYFDNISLRLGYKVAGFTDKSYLKVLAEQSSPGSINESIVIPDENYTVHLHKSAPVDRIVYSAVIIEKTSVGFSVTGYNTDSPFFTIIPSEPNSNKYSISSAGTSALIYNDYQQMKVTVPYGFNFRTKQQLVDFLISYGRYLQSQGFVFDTFNRFLQSQQDWELAAREFLSWSQQGWGVGSILVVSPTMNEIKVVTNGSVVDEINNLPAGSKVLDVNFQVIKGSAFNAVRERDSFSISMAQEITIGLVDLSLVQYEHALVFDNETVFNDVIYKPELGNRQFRLKVIGNKTGDWTGQVAPPGFVYSAPTISTWQTSTDYRKGELVSYKDRYYVALQNITASDTFILGYWKQIEKNSINTGLLPNFAYNAKKFEYMYDVDSQLQDQNINMYSTGLTGFRERSFLTDLGVNTTSQSKFYQGYIRDKGTKDSINALANATFSNLTGNIEFLEEWALRVGEYGATEANQYVEIQLDDSTFNKDPMAFTLLRSGEVPESEDIVGVYQETLYKRPAIFNDSIFTNRNANSNYDSDIQTAGYVNLGDIDATLFDLTDYATLNASLDKIVVGYKIWVAKDYKRDWNVYRVIETPLRVTEANYALDSLITLTFDTEHSLTDGEVFVVKGFSTLVNGFYKVVRADDAFTVVVSITAEAEKQFIETPSVTGAGSVYRFHSLRVTELVDVAEFAPDRGWRDSDKVWVDIDTNNQWAVYDRVMPWHFVDEIAPAKLTASANFGQQVALSPDGGIMTVLATNASVDPLSIFVKTETNVFVESRTASIVLTGSNKVSNVLAMNQQSIAIAFENIPQTTFSVMINVLEGAQLVDQYSLSLPAAVNSIKLSTDNKWMFVATSAIDTVHIFKMNAVSMHFALHSTITGDADEAFAYSIGTNADGSILVVGSPEFEVDHKGKVTVYCRDANTYDDVQVIRAPTVEVNGLYGYSVCVTDNELIVGSPGVSSLDYQKGLVYRYANVPLIASVANYEHVQTIKKPFDSIENFGTVVTVDPIRQVLAIASRGGDTINAGMLDGAEFALDSGSTAIIDAVKETGAVYTFDLLVGATSSKYAFSQQLNLAGAAFGDGFGSSVVAHRGLVFVGAPFDDTYGSTLDPQVEAGNYGSVIRFDSGVTSSGWVKIRSEQAKVDLDNVSRLFTYDRKTQSTSAYLDYIDPAKGKLLGIAEQEIAYKTSFDPANYNVGTNANVAIDASYHWNSKQVGRVWWNLAKVRYVDYEQGDLSYRIANWGRVFPGSVIEVAEWVESDVKPSLYKGIGTPLYANDSAYVADAYVDPVTGVITSRYYFWIINSNEVPLNAGRSISLTTLTAAITAPIQQGIPFAAIVRNDTVAMFSSAHLIKADDTILHIDYSLLDIPGMIHNEYELVQEGAANMSIPPRILNKLIDSLAGTDATGAIVPDINLKLAERYGIGLRPRQTMVVNRLKAVENLVSYVNKVLLATPIVGNYNLNQLYSADVAPTTGWDIKVATLEERSYINTLPLAAGTRVLVESDSDFSNQWIIYELTALKEFKLVQTQVYDTTDYWTYATWYAADYDSTQKPTYTVEFEKDAAKYPIQAGDVVKIKNKGAGTFAIHRYTSATTYDVVGVEAGTIQLKKSLYSQDTDEIGFDNDSFDTIKFDLNPTVEFRHIMYALRDDIFTQDLRDEVSNVFFIMLNYILSEQRMVDWAFKTSFVSVIHKLRKLEQFPNFIKDNQTYYEDYINEVKPYRTKIREYVADYQGDDVATIEATDFDLPSYYDPDFGQWRSPSGEHARDDMLVATVPAYTAWNNNHKLHLDSITIQAGGTQYTHDPVVNIVGGGGTGATAVAVIDYYSGRVIKVLVTNAGSGYTSTPTVEILGDGVGARAYAMMVNPNTRQFDSVIKFDRVTYGSDVTQWTKATFYAAGTQVVYDSKVYVVTHDLTTATYFQAEYFTEIAASELASAADRVMAYYAPKTGMLPKDMRQLFTGVEYPGVNVEGPRYDAGPGFDVPTFDASQYDNFELNSDGTVQISSDQIDTIIATQYLDLAAGTRPEDIDIVGGGYVDVYNSHAPEELLPGMMYDTLDIQVYTVDPVTPDYNKLGYRISKSMLDETKTAEAWEFRRIAASAITTLAEDLLLTDTVIYVVDASKLPTPGRVQGHPGVVYINGEKIIYWTIDYTANTLGQLRRGTWGTGAATVHAAGSKVTDASAVQKMPGNASNHVWLNQGYGTIIDGQGLHKSITEQALFLFADPTLLPWMPGSYEWIDPNLNHFKWDMGAYDTDVGFDSYDQG